MSGGPGQAGPDPSPDVRFGSSSADAVGSASADVAASMDAAGSASADTVGSVSVAGVAVSASSDRGSVTVADGSAVSAGGAVTSATGDATTGGSLTPRNVALGAGDAFLGDVNRAAAAHAGAVFIRPLPEMNGHWNPYSAYNTNGTKRDSSHTTALFRAAFARIACPGDHVVTATIPRRRANPGAGPPAGRSPSPTVARGGRLDGRAASSEWARVVPRRSAERSPARQPAVNTPQR